MAGILQTPLPVLIVGDGLAAERDLEERAAAGRPRAGDDLLTRKVAAVVPARRDGLRAVLLRERVGDEVVVLHLASVGVTERDPEELLLPEEEADVGPLVDRLRAVGARGRRPDGGGGGPGEA